MREPDSGYNESGRGKRKRLPLFSVVLIACYLIVSAFFFVYGFGDGRVPDDPAPATPANGSITPPAEPPQEPPDPVEEPPVELPPAVKVKGIYVGAWFAGNKERMDNYIDLCETTEINSLVLDVKEDHGYITFFTDNEMFTGMVRELIPNMKGLVADLKSRGIYTIARVVCFKDPMRSGANPRFAIQDSQGRPWEDASGTRWLDPYKRENWEYIGEICLEAARMGFEEIQLDYVRFPADGRLSNIDFGPAGEEQTKTEVIAEFMAYIKDLMLKEGLRTSADVFGIIALSDRDGAAIGQDLKLLLPVADSLCPMIYPSHFASKRQNGTGQVINGVLFEAPDTKPYEVIYNTMMHVIRHLDPDAEQAVIRPYLQDFTASYLGDGYYIPYGADEVRAQIQAVYDSGFEEWILWNHISVYSEDAFR